MSEMLVEVARRCSAVFEEEADDVVADGGDGVDGLA